MLSHPPFASLLSLTAIAFSLSIATPAISADDANYTESKIPPYQLPDPLTFSDGRPVDTPEKWRNERRPELLELFAEHVYGHAPESHPEVEFRVRKEVDDFLDGKATLKEIDIVVTKGGSERVITMLLVIPKLDHPAPVFLGLNFGGNHTIHHSTEISLNPNWMRPHYKGVVHNRATEQARGTSEQRWMLSTFLDRGYALATIYYGDIDPDFDDKFQNGIHPFFYEAGQTKPTANQWGSIAAWSWGLSRAMDYLETDPQVDATKTAVFGHSRLGKAALWAGACDERFGLVISNNSGCGGAALSRRRFGEKVAKINSSFPHWFCDNFLRYNDREDELPVDQHELIALIAPRPVYVASAKEDRWADPRGEFLSAYHAAPVYRLLGVAGLSESEDNPKFPPVDQPLNEGTIGYHMRTGGHGMRNYDFLQYLDFADRHFGVDAESE